MSCQYLFTFPNICCLHCPIFVDCYISIWADFSADSTPSSVALTGGTATLLPQRTACLLERVQEVALCRFPFGWWGNIFVETQRRNDEIWPREIIPYGNLGFFSFWCAWKWEIDPIKENARMGKMMMNQWIFEVFSYAPLRKPGKKYEKVWLPHQLNTSHEGLGIVAGTGHGPWDAPLAALCLASLGATPGAAALHGPWPWREARGECRSTHRSEGQHRWLCGRQICLGSNHGCTLEDLVEHIGADVLNVQTQRCNLIFLIWVWINTYINTIFRGMNIHLPAILMFTRGTRFWHTAIYHRSILMAPNKCGFTVSPPMKPWLLSCPKARAHAIAECAQRQLKRSEVPFLSNLRWWNKLKQRSCHWNSWKFEMF